MTSLQRRHPLHTALLACLLGPGVATGALAQQASDAGAAIGRAGALEEIVVTAQRREENLQSVPIAVTALGAHDIQQLRITNINDLSSLAPNLSITPQGQQTIPALAIRGVVSGTSDNAVDPKVGIYVDGIYVGRSVGAIFDLADIERVEVLRGPQGTLFGRNATAGALSIVTAAPTGEFGLRADASLGSDNARRGKLTLNLPEWRGLRTKLSYLYDEIDGYADNLLGGRNIDLSARAAGFGKLRYADQLGGKEVNALHFAAQYDATERLSIDYRFDYSDSDTVGNPVQIVGPLEDQTGQLWGGVLAFQPLTGGVTNQSTARLDPVANASSVEHVETLGHNLTLTWEASDALTLKSISGWRELDQDPNIFDLTATGGVRFSSAQLFALLGGNIGGALDPAAQPGPNDSFFSLLTARSTEQEQFSQELQLQVSTERYELVTGLFYFEEESPATNVLGVFQPVVDGVVMANPLLDALFGSGTTITEANNDSSAAYAQLTWYLNDSVDLTGGLRYTSDNRELRIDSLAGATGAVFGPGDYQVDYEELTYTGTITWRPTADITTYAKVSTGYVSGGLLSGIPYEPETLTSYELGFKSQLLENRLRLNLAAFYSDYEDLQIQAFLNGRQFFDNAGKASIEGAEAELEWLPADGLTLTASVGYTHHSYDEYFQRSADNTFVDITDDVSQQFVPKTTGRLSAQYYAPTFGNGMQAFGRVDGVYQGDTMLTANTLRDPEGQLSSLNDARELAGYWRVGARLGLAGIRLGDAELTASLYGDNLLDEDYYPNANTAFALTRMYARGRTYGLELTLDL
ncbi:TonB-dependent receptor [Parahaliea mediterranea]|uniref:TonB-dependent receptor n=1 Tax=Parahaliea mediterranea TaxID=651086 RepID=A0A939DCW0_9GAMM|nr:TonB-dependent receptor [Parahaliea mediterranea]MBN7795905.1 TonB-dependent receptor [Parahaliea mediterranea]